MLIFTFIDLVFNLFGRGGWLGGTSAAADFQVRCMAGCGHWQCRTWHALEHALWCKFSQYLFVPNIFVFESFTLYCFFTFILLLKWGWLVSSVEWCVFVCNHNARGAQWKNTFTESPVWVQAVMAKGMTSSFFFLNM